MANETSHLLTPDEAKVRLRLAAQRLSPVILIQHYPCTAAGLALIGGFVFGRARMGSVLSRRWLRSLLWQVMFRTL